MASDSPATHNRHGSVARAHLRLEMNSWFAICRKTTICSTKAEKHESAKGKSKMNRLLKFVEQGDDGEKSGRVAYAFASSSLPEPAEGMGWRIARSFNAADELLHDESLGKVFKSAIDNGYAVITRSEGESI